MALGSVAILASSQSLFPFPHPVPSYGSSCPRWGISWAQAHTLRHLTWGELVSCSPDVGTLVAHFVLGSVHLVCASVCVCTVVPSVYPSHSAELHSWAHDSGDIKDAIFMDCCMILKNE